MTAPCLQEILDYSMDDGVKIIFLLKLEISVCYYHFSLVNKTPNTKPFYIRLSTYKLNNKIAKNQPINTLDSNSLTSPNLVVANSERFVNRARFSIKDAANATDTVINKPVTFHQNQNRLSAHKAKPILPVTPDSKPKFKCKASTRLTHKPSMKHARIGP